MFRTGLIWLCLGATVLQGNGYAQEGSIPSRIKRHSGSELGTFLTDTTNNLRPGWPIQGLIEFSSPGGLYPNSFLLQLECFEPETRIHFTLDGSLPDSNSLVYTKPLYLDYSLFSRSAISNIQVSPINLHTPPQGSTPQAIVIRAAAFDNNGIRLGGVYSQSYFIQSLGSHHPGLPVLSLMADPHLLFDHEEGIMVPGVNWIEADPDWTGNYYMRGIEWERPAHAEFYESDGNIGFTQALGLRTRGSNSRRLPQKGLKLYARSEYGDSWIHYPVFPDQNLFAYKRLVLKPFSSSWSQAGIEDYLAHQMARELEIDRLSSRPVVLYLNGEYWGVYILQESGDEDYLELHHGVDSRSVDIIGNWWGEVEYGTADEFNALYDFMAGSDFSDDESYQAATELIDIQNYIDYQLFEIFIANYDWPANNMKCWKERKPGSRWRWIFFDGDAGFQDPDFNGFDHALNTGDLFWPTNGRSTLFLRKLLENESFQEQFFDRMQELVNSQLGYQTTSLHLDECYRVLNPEIGNQLKRFSFPSSYTLWREKMNNIDRFLLTRNREIQHHVRHSFGKSLNIEAPASTIKYLHDLRIYPNPNDGNFTLHFTSSRNGVADLFISNLLGQRHYIGNFAIQSGINLIPVRENKMATGIYHLTLNFNHEFHSIKMVIH